MDEGKCMTHRKPTKLYFSLTNLHPGATTHAAHGVHGAVSHLQQFVEVFDVTFLHLLLWDLRLFEMDVLVVKCLEEGKGRFYVRLAGFV